MNPWTNLVGPILIVLIASLVGKYVLDAMLEYRLERKSLDLELENLKLEAEALKHNPYEWVDEWDEYIAGLPETDDED